MHSNHTAKYLSGIFILTFTSIIIGYFVYKQLSLDAFYRYFICTVVLFFVTNIIFHFILVKSVEKKPIIFTNLYLILTISKILIYLVFLIVFVLNFSTGIKSFLLSFLVLYFAYTIFEVIILSKYVKKQGAK